MAEGKKYFWLKLREDFFGSLRIKRLRKLAGGDTFVVIYLKMQLKALRSDGVLTWKGYEDAFVDELALDLDEEPDNVRMTLAYLLRCGLAETSDNVNFFLPSVVENTGKEGDSAKRVREYRERLALQCNALVTPEKESNIENRTPQSPQEGEVCARGFVPDHMPDAFASIWSQYPQNRRGRIQSAIRAWNDLRPDSSTVTAIHEALACQVSSDEWSRGIGIPWLTSYLKCAYWEDVEPP